ncbi:DUF4270 family protein [Geofilum sp. OHC36d9]|uniref:DUF4270 family protein n=1 Tax=Geofilum sp. OHC36d9 TaxID=3458413 RepID=UPI004033ECA3
MKYPIFFVIASITHLLVACSNDDFSLGSKMVDSQAHSVIIDTCTVSLTTLKIDSLETSGKGLLIVGKLTDDLRGTIMSESFVSYSKPNFSDTRTYASTPYILDSLTLEFNYDTYYTGDTTAYQEFEIYQLKSPLKLPDTGDFYNTSTVSSQSDRLVATRFIPHPNLGQAMVVRLPDDMGNDLLNKLSTSDDDVSTSELFQEYFPGFRITPTNNNAAIFSYSVGDSSSVIKLYYHYTEEEIIEKELSIEPISSTSFFRVDHDYSQTPIKNLTDDYEGLSSTISDNMSYLMGLAGFYTRIEFPYLNEIAKLGTAGIVQGAQLSIYPVKSSFAKESDLPQSLSLYVADKFGSTVDAITDSYGSSLQTGSLVYDDIGGQNTYYSFTITDFIDTQIFALGLDKQVLQLTLPDEEMNTTFKSLIMGDSNQNVKLKIIYNLYE